MAKPTFKPGQSAPRSGQYEMLNPSGSRTNVERTVVKDEPLPPTLSAGQRYVLVDPTRNGAGRGRP